MVYIKRWPDFQAQSLELYRNSPNRTRYLIKTHPNSQWLVLKVTDNDKVLKYRSRSAIILNRFESFNKDLTALMAGQQPPSLIQAAASSTEASALAPPTAKADTGVPTSAEKTAGTTGTGTGTGASTSESAKKKKKKKGKK